MGNSQYCLRPAKIDTLVRTVTMSSKAVEKFHVKCRHPNEYRYIDKESGAERRIVRKQVPAGYISWAIPFDTYDPISFTAPFVLKAPWADKEIGDPDFKPKWNQVDGNVNRKSYEGPYQISRRKEPMNVRGRTGLRGRGVLGRWGPNHAADPIVTRWKRSGDHSVVKHEKSGKKVLQFVAIQRRDTGEWAIPGGMVDPGENVSATVKREFMEEALNSTELKDDDRSNAETMVSEFFDKNGVKVYEGYVDDPRNTDNAWMETTAFLFHDETGEHIGKFKLKAGDDAKALKWIDLDASINLYASHADFLKKVAEMKDAHW